MTVRRRGREADARAAVARRACSSATTRRRFRSAVTGQANAILLVAAARPASSTARSGSATQGARAARLSRGPARGVVRRQRPRVERVQARRGAARRARRAPHALVGGDGRARAAARARRRLQPPRDQLASCRAPERRIDHVLVPGSTTARSTCGRTSARRAQWRGALRPRARRDEDRVTPEEARVALPGARAARVPERGHVRPARAADRRRGAGAARRDLADGPLRHGVLRAHARPARRRPGSRSRGLVGAEPEQVALTGSTTDGCNIVLAGLDLGRTTRS